MTDLATERLGQVPFAGGVFDQEHFPRTDFAAFTIARDDEDAGIELYRRLAVSPPCGT